MAHQTGSNALKITDDDVLDRSNQDELAYLGILRGFFRNKQMEELAYRLAKASDKSSESGKVVDLDNEIFLTRLILLASITGCLESDDESGRIFAMNASQRTLASYQKLMSDIKAKSNTANQEQIRIIINELAASPHVKVLDELPSDFNENLPAIPEKR